MKLTRIAAAVGTISALCAVPLAHAWEPTKPV